ncbi:hypothetical protein [Methanolobus chelungpuianus]|uniref:hypothetical protein n=1 Tax=Methanolobus chelungpuianus TaxID=502115 RepID=UPI002115014F|nr:hypothetical protein [Methanolobus chelungpuianus]
MLVLLYIVFPFVLVGSPTSFFTIWNRDVVSHEVTIQIFDSNDRSLLREQYTVEPDESISKEKPFSMIFKALFKGTLDDYVVVATLDNNSSTSYKIGYQLWNTPEIEISDNQIFIGEISV